MLIKPLRRETSGKVWTVFWAGSWGFTLTVCTKTVTYVFIASSYGFCGLLLLGGHAPIFLLLTYSCPSHLRYCCQNPKEHSAQLGQDCCSDKLSSHVPMWGSVNDHLPSVSASIKDLLVAQVSNTSPSTLFYPTWHFVYTWCQCQTLCPEAPASVLVMRAMYVRHIMLQELQL